MKRTHKVSVYIVILSLFLWTAGCKSQPDPQPELPPESVQPAPVKDEAQEKSSVLLNTVKKARTEAVEFEADARYPQEFNVADETASDAQKAHEAGQFEQAAALAEKAVLQYRTLSNRKKIEDLKNKIQKYALDSYDAENFEKAEQVLAQIGEAYTHDPKKAFELSKEALTYYQMVVDAGFSILMNDAKKTAEEARTRCDSIKAAASMKDAYTEEVNRCRYAVIDADNRRFEKAYIAYSTAVTNFNTIYDAVKVKQTKALEAMEKARMRQAASSKLAQDADREVPLPENAEGFSSDPIEVVSLDKTASQEHSEHTVSGEAGTPASAVMSEQSNEMSGTQPLQTTVDIGQNMSESVMNTETSPDTEGEQK